MAAKKSDVLLSAKIFAKVMGIRMEARPPSTGAFARHLQEFESVRDFFTVITSYSIHYTKLYDPEGRMETTLHPPYFHLRLLGRCCAHSVTQPSAVGAGRP